MLTLRPAQPGDVKEIRQLIYELALYEKEPDKAVATEEGLLRDGFGERPHFWVVMAEWEGRVAGFALYLFNYSTWEGRPGLYLEDLFVRPEHRGRGIGKALLVHLARIAIEKGCTRYQWQVLDWNTPAIGFYESLGGRVQKEWLTVRVQGDELAHLAGRGRPYTVVFDGDCKICTRISKVLIKWDTGRQLEVVSSQAPGLQARFPWIPAQAYRDSLQLIGPAGETTQRAEAIEQLLSVLPRGGLIGWVFRVPFARPLLDRLYRWFARNRYRLGCGDHCPYRPEKVGPRDS